MFKHYYNLEQLKYNQYKDIIYFKNNKKLYCYILYSDKEIKENKKFEFVEADVLSYGENYSRVITNFQTLKFLALNPDENMIEPKIIKNVIKGSSEPSLPNEEYDWNSTGVDIILNGSGSYFEADSL